MAEGAFRKAVEAGGVADRFVLDSAGLGDWHVGQAPDERAQAAAARRGIDITKQSARQVGQEDFRRFDLVLAMDRSNYAALRRLAPQEDAHKVLQFLDFAPHLGARDVPDPFFGGAAGFDAALDLIEQASFGLLGALIADQDSNPQDPEKG